MTRQMFEKGLLRTMQPVLLVFSWLTKQLKKHQGVRFDLHAGGNSLEVIDSVALLQDIKSHVGEPYCTDACKWVQHQAKW